MDQLPIKKNTNSDEASGNVKEKSKRKSSTSTTVKDSKPKFDTHRASKLPAKVTKPALINKHVTSSLDKIYNSAKGHTLPVALLARNPVTTSDQNMVSQAPILHNAGMTEEIDGGWFEDTAELDIQIQQNPWRADRLPSPEVTASQAQDHYRRRKPHQRLLDISSESELDGFQSQNISYQISTQCSNKRKANVDIDGSSKKVCTEKQNNPRVNSAVSLQASASTAFNGRTGGIITISDPTEAAEVSPQVALDEVTEMSQEIASYQPFKITNGNEMDFMAQFEDCCEFVD